MLTNYRELFRLVHLRPGMYGVRTYWETAALVTGCDAGTGWMLLEGFREWLQLRIGANSSLGWSSMVVQLADPTYYERSPRAFTPTVETAALDLMFELLDQFLAIREQHGGLARIFAEYAQRQKVWEDGKELTDPAVALEGVEPRPS
ncbi:hypothetical protein [Micromonospora sp. NPDC004704]